MKRFARFYNWAFGVKLNMGIYTIALLFANGIFVLLTGGNSIVVWTILQMTLTAFAVSSLQYACFPPHKDLDKPALRGRTILWGLGSNVLFIGASVIFNWFSGIPGWGTWILILMLEFALVAMWVAIHITQKLETDELN
ncbi:MAG: hypothetical protein VB049_06010, partial [Candidatus Pelethousia sp.]|nr:hypothetical protein [Candidatus Pelethousia sp.]